jgi:tetratricopeptide (TPR) repeat protein
LLRWHVSSFLAWSASWLLLFSFPGQLMFLDSTWVLQYMRDSVLRGDLQRFINSFFLKNKGVEPSLVYITDIEHLSDRAALVWQLMGWGWLLTAIGLVLIVISMRLRRILPVGGIPTMMFALVSPIVLLLVIGSSSLIGEARQMEGDRKLAQGAYREAVNAYTQALDQDALLGRSTPFLTKVSAAHYLAYGDSEPLAQYFLLNQEVVSKTLDQAEDRMRTFSTLQFKDSPFRESMIRLIAKKTAETYVSLGIDAITKGNVGKSRQYFEIALAMDPDLVNAQFFLAKTLLDTNSLVAGLKLAESLPDKVYHPSVKADFYSLIGDFHRRTGNLIKAREAYSSSYELDNKDNYRAMKEISGT